MKVHYNFDNYKVQKPVITVGAFDGVHKGHVEILNLVRNYALKINGESIVVTFWPHPRLVLNHDESIRLLNTLDEKLSLFANAGIDHVVVIPFTEEFSELSSNQFIEEIMVKKLNVNHLIVGFNHHFGKGREGNFETMKEHAGHFGFTIEKLDAQMVENEKVSSTLIRKALNEGDIELANKCLGYHYSITGKVLEGKKIGRTIGFPTANVLINEAFKLVPKVGVYAVIVSVDGRQYPGMLNIGYNPTIDSSNVKLSIEVHLINFADNLYDKEITLIFQKRVRDEVKFEGLDHLKKQLNADKAEIMKILGV
ncbi:MAG TPA: bifunctional riboflavin kinase/FAD synthetase [Bacteroidales bacterium]